jgi:hypothetical protein
MTVIMSAPASKANFPNCLNCLDPSRFAQGRTDLDHIHVGSHLERHSYRRR